MGNDQGQRLLLEMAGGEWCSGERLAAAVAKPGELPLSRMAISKAVRQLQQAGYPIESKHGAGYRLLLSAECLVDAEALADMLGVPVTAFAVTASTNDEARQWLSEASAGRSAGAALFVAGFQTAGRGRLQRKWQAQPSQALLFSLAWRFQRFPPDLPALSLLVGLALVKALQALAVPASALGIKWPNDVLLNGRKLAGILIEASIQQEQVNAVIGVGVNVGAAPVGDLRYPATDLQAEGYDIAAPQLLKEVARQLNRDLNDFAELGFAPFVADYRRFDLVVGRELEIEGEMMRVQVVDDSGALCLQNINSGEQKRFVSGEVSLPWPAC